MDNADIEVRLMILEAMLATLLAVETVRYNDGDFEQVIRN